ncbi:MAG: hypothetical protein Kow0077_30220 [Anaerolineae bacterium]
MAGGRAILKVCGKFKWSIRLMALMHWIGLGILLSGCTLLPLHLIEARLVDGVAGTVLTDRPTAIGDADVALDGGGWDGTLRRIAVPILMYHYISEPPEDADIYRQDLSVRPEDFRSQMQYLADEGYAVISLYDLNQALRWGTPLPEKPVIITFDDGYIDAFEQAFPVLQEFGFTATFFVITSRLDEGHPAYISWEQARIMAEAGMSIESHTKDHPNLIGRPPDYLYYQVLGSIESIEAHTNRPARLFSYPGGRWDENTLAALRSYGVWAAVVTEGGTEHTTDGLLLLRRVRVSGETDLLTFAALVRWDWEQPGL